MRTPEQRFQQVGATSKELPAPSNLGGLHAQVAETWTVCEPGTSMGTHIGVTLLFDNQKTLNVFLSPEGALRLEWAIQQARKTDPLIFQ